MEWGAGKEGRTNESFQPDGNTYHLCNSGYILKNFPKQLKENNNKSQIMLKEIKLIISSLEFAKFLFKFFTKPDSLH